jgi:hypothetical protein
MFGRKVTNPKAGAKDISNALYYQSMGIGMNVSRQDRTYVSFSDSSSDLKNGCDVTELDIMPAEFIDLFK